MAESVTDADVLCVRDDHDDAIGRLLARFNLKLVRLHDGEPIAGSFWGEPEAGIVATSVYARPDTPIHSVLHETSHVICMTDERRASLEGDAGGDNIEEAAVCYLQILLADHLTEVGSARLMQDMDAWGYSFRLGSTARWFADDAEDARAWLVNAGLIDAGGRPCWVLRQ